MTVLQFVMNNKRPPTSSPQAPRALKRQDSHVHTPAPYLNIEDLVRLLPDIRQAKLIQMEELNALAHTLQLQIDKQTILTDELRDLAEASMKSNWDNIHQPLRLQIELGTQQRLEELAAQTKHTFHTLHNLLETEAPMVQNLAALAKVLDRLQNFMAQVTPEGISDLTKKFEQAIYHRQKMKEQYSTVDKESAKFAAELQEKFVQPLVSKFGRYDDGVLAASLADSVKTISEAVSSALRVITMAAQALPEEMYTDVTRQIAPLLQQSNQYDRRGSPMDTRGPASASWRSTYTPPPRPPVGNPSTKASPMKGISRSPSRAAGYHP